MYDRIGTRYLRTRRPDPRIAVQIWNALGAARRVVNIGAGTGNYEPADRFVVAVEPSTTMLLQRAVAAPPAVQAVAEALPFPDRSFDAALATFTLHHWNDLTAGLAEMKRVSLRQVLVMADIAMVDTFWLLTDYLPEVMDLPWPDRDPDVIFVRENLNVVSEEPLMVPADCQDGFLCGYWSRPEAYLQPDVTSNMSALALLEPDILAAGQQRLADDLRSGRWDQRYGHLRLMSEMDCGYRLVIATS